MKFCSFDLEIAKVIDDFQGDLFEHRPLGITCAATVLTGDQHPTLWFDDCMSNPKNPTYKPQMSRHFCRELVDYLMTMHSEGYIPLTWNGFQFDFVVLAEESGMWRECKNLALNHVDMMYHFFCLNGYFCALENAAKGMGLEGKTDGMTGKDAPRLWAEGEYEKVLTYVGNDVTMPLELAQRVNHEGVLNWFTKAGNLKQTYINSWRTVLGCDDLPLPNTSWMSNPRSRGDFFKYWRGY